MCFIYPLDSFMIFSKMMAFFKLTTTSPAFGFTQLNFIKRRWMINKRVIGGDFIIIEIEIAIRVKRVVTDIIKQGIIASAKHCFKQVIKDQMILW